MSTPYVETDAIRAARKAATIQIGRGAHGQPVYAQQVIDPSGHLIQVADGARLKPGYRYATEKDVEEKRAAERARREAEGA